MDKRHITASGAVTTPMPYVSKPTAAARYLMVAKNLRPGIEALIDKPGALPALALVSAHVVECLLKAYLAAKGMDAEMVKKFHHNLAELWKAAVDKGLPARTEPPHWFIRLDELHSDYSLRYMDRVEVLIPPNARPMVSEVLELFEVVSREV